jgi:hypothetical protein
MAFSSIDNTDGLHYQVDIGKEQTALISERQVVKELEINQERHDKPGVNQEEQLWRNSREVQSVSIPR